MSKRKVKKVNQVLIENELKKLTKVLPLVVETDSLLENLEVKSISEFEDSINKKSGFVNAMMSAVAYGKDAEYKRLLELEKLIDNRLTSEDLDAEKELKTTFVESIKEKYTTYFTDEELVSKKALDKVMKDYNSLTLIERQQIGYSNGTYELIYSPFSDLRL